MTTIEQRLHAVMGNLIGNESLATSLSEGAAGELFSWSEAIAKQIVEQTDRLDDEAAEAQMTPQLRAMRLMLRAIGRWVGEADTLDVETTLALWSRIGEQGHVVFGDTFVLPALESVTSQMPSGVDAQQLIAWLRTFIEANRSKG